MKTLDDNLLYRLTKPALIKTIKELYAIREEAIKYINNHINQETFEGYLDSYEISKLGNILQGNKEE